MAAIDLIVLGMLKREPLSAYDLQKLVEYRQISKWVKISKPSIYKKVLHLEEKGLLRSVSVREGNMPEKAVYSLTPSGERAFAELMREVAAQPLRIFLDFNAVIVNLDSLPPEERRERLADLARNVQELKACLEENRREKEDDPEVPETGKAVLRQQFALVRALEDWLEEFRAGR